MAQQPHNQDHPKEQPKPDHQEAKPADKPVTEYDVRGGESLSEIAKEIYGDGTEHYWRAIYEANKTLIGSDPNLIKPGYHLVIPPKPAPEHKT